MEPSPLITENTSAKSFLLRRDAILSAVAFAGQQFLRSDDWSANIDAVLERLGQATGVERVYVFQDHTDSAGKAVASLRYEWVQGGGQRLLPSRRLRNAPYFGRSTVRWRASLQAGETLIGRFDQSPPAARRVFHLLLVKSFVAVPVFVAGQWWGAIGFADSQTSRDWSDTELDALRVAASLLGAAFERQQIALERAESERFWSLMARLSTDGLEAEDEDSLLAATVEQLASVIHADHCLILLWNELTEQATPAAATSVLRRLMSSMANPSPPPDPLMNILVRERRTLVNDDIAALGLETTSILGVLPIASGIAAPMTAQNQVFGAVFLGFTAPHSITALEQERVELAAQQLARLVFNARLFRAETQARQRAETLQAVGQVIGSTLNLSEVLERILSELQRVVPYDSASLQRLENNHSVVIAGQGFRNPGQQIGLAFDVSDASLPNKAVYESQHSAILTDVMASHEEFSANRHASSYVRAWMGVPLVFAGQTIGMLTLDKTEPGYYTDQHAKLAEAFAAQAAIALENARLYEVTRQLNTQVWRQAEQLRHVIDAVADGIVLLDAQNNIVLANTMFYEYLPSLTGVVMAETLDHLCGRPLAWYLEQADDVGWREAQAVGETHRIFAISANRVNIGPDAGGLVLSISDVTAERELREVQRAHERLATIGAMAGRIAHDFNNILQGVIGFADLLSKNSDIPAGARQRLALMAGEGRRGADLIRLIVEYSREKPINQRPVDMQALIVRAVRLWESRVQKPVVVSWENNEPVSWVVGDEVWLLEILTALVADADQTLPLDRPVSVHLANRSIIPASGVRRPGGERGHWVVVEITGGSQWFTSPEQVHALQNDLPLIYVSDERNVMLAQVQGVVRQHRGTISVETKPDGGCQVSLALPAAASVDTDNLVTAYVTGSSIP